MRPIVSIAIWPMHDIAKPGRMKNSFGSICAVNVFDAPLGCRL
jgi:hypothetical protein